MTHENSHDPSTDQVSAIRWQDDTLFLLDQRLLPLEEKYLACHDAEEVASAITAMVVRGAPAIGIAAAYGVVLAARAHEGDSPASLEPAMAILAASRPTAVNLFWALKRMQRSLAAAGRISWRLLESEAIAIHEEDIAANHRIGDLGADLIGASQKEEEHSHGKASTAVITHCNTGTLATGGYGTALGVIRSAWRDGLFTKVFADETRPWLQGARLTAWELGRDGISTAIIADGAAAHVMRTQAIGWVIVGADRISANGDVANKIGTYSLAVLARHHGVKVMVAAHTGTIDMELANGDAIPIEERSMDELKTIQGRAIAPDFAQAFNPVFDVTPASLIDAIVTEKGVVRAPDTAGMRELMNRH